MNSPIADIEYLVLDQQNPEVLVNMGFQNLEQLCALKFKLFNSNTPDATPSEGDAYFTGSSPTGAWAGQASMIAIYYAGWRFFAPQIGMRAWNYDTTVQDIKGMIQYSSLGWFPIGKRWSATEHFTGRYDVLGNPIYSKGFIMDVPTVAGTPTSAAHGITNLELGRPVVFEGYVRDGDAGSATVAWAAPGAILFGATISRLNYFADSTNVYVAVDVNHAEADYETEFRIEYCRDL